MRAWGLVAATTALWIAMPTKSAAQGYQVQPMLATIAPSGPNARLTMSIKNTGAVPITLEMTPFRATVDGDGAASRVDEAKDVLIYPAQTEVAPGKEQTVQVRYIGDPAIADARMYGVRVSQLPISAPGFVPAVGTSGASSDVKVSFNFLSHVIVSPDKAKAVIAVKDVGRAPNGDLMLTITNTGPGIAVLNASNFTLTDTAGKSVVLEPDSLKIGEFSAFMPRQSRRASVPAKLLAGLVGTITPTLTVQ